MAIRDELHRLIDELSDQLLPAAQHYLETLRATSDPLVALLEAAPIDDEPVTDEEEAGVAEAIEQIRRGETLTAEEAKRMLT